MDHSNSKKLESSDMKQFIRRCTEWKDSSYLFFSYMKSQVNFYDTLLALRCNMFIGHWQERDYMDRQDDWGERGTWCQASWPLFDSWNPQGERW